MAKNGDLIINGTVIAHNNISGLGRGNGFSVNAIVLHRTGGSTARGALDSYAKTKIGVHFTIDRNGDIYQSASLHQSTAHVGKIKSRCYASGSCSGAETAKYKKLGFSPGPTHNLEKRKAYPSRYPMGSDSIGIEVVGVQDSPGDNGSYEPLTDAQVLSLNRLVDTLKGDFNLTDSDIHTHHEISYKSGREGQRAKEAVE